MKQKKNSAMALPAKAGANTPEPPVGANGAELVADILGLIQTARQNTAVAVNAELTMLYWRVGERIRRSILRQGRAEYGEKILQTLSAKLCAEYGRGWSVRNLANMVRFAEVWPDPAILHALRAKLSWTHFRQLIYLKDPLKRDFYAEMARVEGWSSRTLTRRIDSMLYERTAISRKPEEVARAELASLRDEDKMRPELVLKDPYILDFLGLNDRYLEKDAEDAILREMEQFLLELGAGFAFVARQKRIQIDGDDFYLDLLFFNRKLNRLVALELKLGDFQAAYKGQMELYLRWLDKHERGAQEAPPLGIILCTGKKQEQIELLELGEAGIHVGEYWTVLPDKELLQRKLHAAVESSRRRLTREGSE